MLVRGGARGEQRFDGGLYITVLRVADDDLAQSSALVEEELGRPGRDAVTAPKREVVVESDGPDDALSREALLDVRPRALGRRLRGVNSDYLQASRTILFIEAAQCRH